MQLIQHLGAGAVSLALLALALPAQAHICMEAPMSRVGPSCTSASAQKPGPCGINTRSTKYVTECRPGQTLTVTLNETINHDSHYRIAFNPNGATFEDPTGIDDKDGKHPFVLLDGIKDESAARQSVKVTLPNTPCDQCTLQLIQVMYDKTGNGFGTDDVYYACADIVLKGAPATGECGVAGDAGAPTDPGIVAPKPASDAGSGAPLPPVQTTDAGSSTDAGGTSGGTDAGSASGSTDGSTPSGSGQNDASSGSSTDDDEDEEDGGGCSLSAQRRDRDLSTIVTLLTVLVLLARRLARFDTLVHRRRRRG